MEKLALFDIDLTLINTGGCGKRAMTLAFRKITGQTNGLDKVSFAGRTDPAIFRDALQALNIEWQQSLQDKFKDLYIEILRDEINKPDKRKFIKPGILELLSGLQIRPDVTLALLTGNWYEGAKIKLEHFNLFHYFEFGAFADDAWIRSELPEIAAQKYYTRTGKSITPGNVFVIGDTPRDVECAKPFGAKSVAVATGFFSMEQLKAANPDYLFTDFSDVSAVEAIFD